MSRRNRRASMEAEADGWSFEIFITAGRVDDTTTSSSDSVRKGRGAAKFADLSATEFLRIEIIPPEASRTMSTPYAQLAGCTPLIVNTLRTSHVVLIVCG